MWNEKNHNSGKSVKIQIKPRVADVSIPMPASFYNCSMAL